LAHGQKPSLASGAGFAHGLVPGLGVVPHQVIMHVLGLIQANIKTGVE